MFAVSQGFNPVAHGCLALEIYINYPPIPHTAGELICRLRSGRTNASVQARMSFCSTIPIVFRRSLMEAKSFESIGVVVEDGGRGLGGIGGEERIA